jgi:signal transduction histidine kinase
LIPVRDSGIEIAEALQRQPFQPFQPADGAATRSYGGIGLGLAIASCVIERMDGAISVVSVAGQGATFYVQVPFRKV